VSAGGMTTSARDKCLGPSFLIEQSVRLYNDFEGVQTPLPSVLADGQDDRREVPTVVTMEMDFSVGAVAAKTIADCASATFGRIVNLDAAVENRLTPAWRGHSGQTNCDARCTHGRHVMFTPENSVGGQRCSSRRSTHFEQGWYR
jgi:hypothetical protein